MQHIHHNFLKTVLHLVMNNYTVIEKEHKVHICNKLNEPVISLNTTQWELILDHYTFESQSLADAEIFTFVSQAKVTTELYNEQNTINDLPY